MQLRHTECFGAWQSLRIEVQLHGRDVCLTQDNKVQCWFRGVACCVLHEKNIIAHLKFGYLNEIQPACCMLHEEHITAQHNFHFMNQI